MPANLEGANPVNTAMPPKIYVAGHRGMVGSAIVRQLTRHSRENRHSREGGEPPPVSHPRESGDPSPSPLNQIYNVAVGDRTTLQQLFALIRDELRPHGVPADTQPVYRDFRSGDVRHSQADIGKAHRLLGYAPTHRIAQGVAQAMPWYVMQQDKECANH